MKWTGINERDNLVRQSFQAAVLDVQEPFMLVPHVILTGLFDFFSKRIPIAFFALAELNI